MVEPWCPGLELSLFTTTLYVCSLCGYLIIENLCYSFQIILLWLQSHEGTHWDLSADVGGSQSWALAPLVQRLLWCRREERGLASQASSEGGQPGHERGCGMRLEERRLMTPCPERCLPCHRVYGGNLVLGTPEHSKVQGSEMASGPKEELPPRKGHPERVVVHRAPAPSGAP